MVALLRDSKFEEVGGFRARQAEPPFRIRLAPPGSHANRGFSGSNIKIAACARFDAISRLPENLRAWRLLPVWPYFSLIRGNLRLCETVTEAAARSARPVAVRSQLHLHVALTIGSAPTGSSL